MQRERVTNDIYMFTSKLYAQVTASVIITSVGAVLVDTLAYPEETRQVKRFIEERLGHKIRYVINTHYHADHTMGTYLFDDAIVIAHSLCRDYLDTRGRESLERVRANAPDLREAQLILPHIIFDEKMTLHLGNKTLEMWLTPGHSMDSIVCHVKEDQVLLAADTIMPVPYFVDGGYDEYLKTLQNLKEYTFENIVQGHGEVVLRGEVTRKVQEDIDYLLKLRDFVDEALTSENSQQALENIDIEDCGKNRLC